MGHRHVLKGALRLCSKEAHLASNILNLDGKFESIRHSQLTARFTGGKRI